MSTVVVLSPEELSGIVERAAARGAEMALERAGVAASGEVLTREEAAALLRLHPASLGRLASSGRVPASRVGQTWRFRRSELLAWLEERATRPGAPVERIGATLRAVKGGR